MGRLKHNQFAFFAIAAKRVELGREIAPNVTRIALLMNPTNPNVKIEEADAEAGAKKLGMETITVNARNASEMEVALEQLLSDKASMRWPNALFVARGHLLTSALSLEKPQRSFGCCRDIAAVAMDQ